MKSSLPRIDPEIKRSIERWENEGGRLPLAGARDVWSTNDEDEWAFLVSYKGKTVAVQNEPPNMN